MKETIPLVVFVIAHQIALLINAGVLTYQLLMAESGKRVNVLLWELFHLWPLAGVKRDYTQEPSELNYLLSSMH